MAALAANDPLQAVSNKLSWHTGNAVKEYTKTETATGRHHLASSREGLRGKCRQLLAAAVLLVEPTVRCLLALGGIAWSALLAAVRTAGWAVERTPFGPGASTLATSASGRPVLLLASYHPSQQNTFTGRLTEEMLDGVLNRARVAAGL